MQKNLEKDNLEATVHNLLVPGLISKELFYLSPCANTKSLIVIELS